MEQTNFAGLVDRENITETPPIELNISKFESYIKPTWWFEFKLGLPALLMDSLIWAILALLIIIFIGLFAYIFFVPKLLAAIDKNRRKKNFVDLEGLLSDEGGIHSFDGLLITPSPSKDENLHKILNTREERKRNGLRESDVSKDDNVEEKSDEDNESESSYVSGYTIGSSISEPRSYISNDEVSESHYVSVVIRELRPDPLPQESDVPPFEEQQ